MRSGNLQAAEMIERYAESVRVPVIIAGGWDPTTLPKPSEWCSQQASI